jgi:hypothetical protein
MSWSETPCGKSCDWNRLRNPTSRFWPIPAELPRPERGRRLALVADALLSGTQMARELDRPLMEGGKPKMVVSNNVSDLTSNSILTCANQRVSQGTTSRRASHALHRVASTAATGQTQRPGNTT